VCGEGQGFGGDIGGSRRNAPQSAVHGQRRNDVVTEWIVRSEARAEEQRCGFAEPFGEAAE
jgi:hypothetical protein